jgi:Ran GTPase-activating protein (RanGAP) involved in mRNA processing and transport
MTLVEFQRIPNVEYELTLTEAEVSHESIRGICEKFRSMQTLLYLSLSNVHLNDSLFAYLFDGLQHCLQLVYLDLSFNDLGDSSMRLLSRMLGPDYVVNDLNLAHNRICSLGCQRIASALRENDTLETLDLACNACGDEGGIAILQSLCANKSLESLSMSCNGITGKLLGDLVRVLSANETILILNLSGNPMGIKTTETDFGDLKAKMEKSAMRCDFRSCGFSEDQMKALNQVKDFAETKRNELPSYARMKAMMKC